MKLAGVCQNSNELAKQNYWYYQEQV